MTETSEILALDHGQSQAVRTGKGSVTVLVGLTATRDRADDWPCGRRNCCEGTA
jgi:hypothetical protein